MAHPARPTAPAHDGPAADHGAELPEADLRVLHAGRLPQPLTRPRARAVNRYLFELRDRPAGRPTNLDRRRIRGMLIEANLSVVRYVEARFGGRPDLRPDIHQAGAVGLIKAVDGFDPEYRVEFTTYAIPVIDGEIKRFFRDTGWAVRVPRPVKELSSQVRRASLDLEQEHGRRPNERQLVERTGQSTDGVRAALRAAAGTTAVSLDTPATAEEGAVPLADTLGETDRELDLVDFRESLHSVLPRLPPRERSIVILRFFGEMSQAEIGHRIGLSQMHVSRLLTASLRRLRYLLTDDR